MGDVIFLSLSLTPPDVRPITLKFLKFILLDCTFSIFNSPDVIFSSFNRELAKLRGLIYFGECGVDLTEATGV